MNFRIHIAILAAALGSAFGLTQTKTLLLLPTEMDLQKSPDLATVNDLYREAVQNAYKGNVKAPQDAHHQCSDRECATKLAAEDKVDEVIFSSVKRLGSKWIFSSTYMAADGNDAFNQRATAISVEDLEPVTRRVADAVLSKKSLEEVADIDNVTGKEETTEPERRMSLT